MTAGHEVHSENLYCSRGGGCSRTLDCEKFNSRRMVNLSSAEEKNAIIQVYPDLHKFSSNSEWFRSRVGLCRLVWKKVPKRTMTGIAVFCC